MSKTLDKINLLYNEGPKNSEELGLFFNKEAWNQEDYFDIKYNRLLDPHIRDYFSPLKPGFLYQIKNPQVLNSFKVFMSRDGLAGLGYFFCRNPFPSSASITLLIPGELGFLVPDSWIDQCAFFQIRSTRKEPKQADSLFLEACCLQESINLKSIDTLLSTIDKYSSIEKVYTSIGFSTNFKSNKDLYRDTTLFTELLRKVNAKFDFDVEYITPEKLFSISLANGIYLNLNAIPFWYYDSYLKYNILETGAYPLEKCFYKGNEQLTFKHGLFQEIDIFTELPENVELGRASFEKDRSSFHEIFSKEFHRARNKAIIEEIEILSPELKSILQYRFNEIYEN